MAEPLKCPFCGRIPTVEDCGTNRWFVRCQCGIAQDKLYHQRCDAVRAWNRRKSVTDVPSAQPEPPEDICGECDAWNKYKSEIKALPSAQPMWIPVTERLPNHELAIVQYSDGDFDLLQFPTAYRRKDIVAWMPLPEPYAERRQDGTRD